MKAVRATSTGAVEVVDVPEPTAGPGDAVMRTRAAGICGSDLLDWYVRGKAGSVLGHEVSGEVASGGEGAPVRAGERIAPHHHAPCLACDACRAGRYVHCAEWRASRLDPGGFAELVRVPAGNLARDTARVPDGVSHEAAAFVEPLATVVKALRRSGLGRGDSFLCVGLGPAGQLAIRLARSRGAGRVAGADPVASRRAAAQDSGADAVLDPSPGDRLGRAARDLTGGRGFDVVLVGPGKREVVRDAFDAVADGGTLLLFTMAPRGEEWPAPLHDLYFREVSVVPSYSCGPDDTAEALEEIASGRVRVGDLVSHRFPIARAAEAFARARNPEGAMKVMIVFE